MSNITENAKKDENRQVFVETDKVSAFPKDTIAAIRRKINQSAQDLSADWSSAIVLVDHAFKELKVPKPTIAQTARWAQYKDMISIAVNDLYESRGLSGSWRTSDK